MHAGMFFDVDTGISIKEGKVEHHETIRVEHYAKGAPPDTRAFLESRQVPAVTGAFISLSRSWFETLGGFSLDYVFGHYEDADLCLRESGPWGNLSGCTTYRFGILRGKRIDSQTSARGRVHRQSLALHRTLEGFDRGRSMWAQAQALSAVMEGIARGGVKH